MWPRLLLAIAILVVLCNGYEDKYSCDFNGRNCNWFVKNLTKSCNWKFSDGQFKGKKGYVVLNGSNNCVSQLNWAFLFFLMNPKMITFEYYVTGPGPYSLNVTSEKSYKPEWTCEIQPGDQRRVGYAAPMQKSNLLIISASVAAGSQIIITQVWKGLNGSNVEYTCPLLRTSNITTRRPSHPSYNVTHIPEPVTKNSMNSSTESSSSSSSSIFMQYFLSLKGKLVGFIRNITLSVKLDYDEDKKSRSKFFSFNQK